MMNRNSVTTLVFALAVLTASCAHDSSTSSGASASQDAAAKKQSSTNRAPDVPLNQQGGY